MSKDSGQTFFPSSVPRDPPKSHLIRHYEEGDIALKADDPKKAARLLTKAIRSYDNQIDRENDLAVVYCVRSMAQFRLKNYQAALEDARQCVRYRPNWSKVEDL